MTQSQFSVQKEELEKEIKNLSSLNCHKVVTGTSVIEGIEILKKQKLSSLAIVSKEKPDEIVGIVTESDIVSKFSLMEEDWHSQPFDAFMTPYPKTLKESDKMNDAVSLISERGFRNIPITDEKGAFKGILDVGHLLLDVAKLFPEQVQKFGVITEWNFLTVDDYSENFVVEKSQSSEINGNIFMCHLKRAITTPPLLLSIDYTIEEVIQCMKEQKKSSVLLMRYETELKGIITERDILFKVLGNNKITLKDKAINIMTPNPHTLLGKHYIAHAVNNMFHFSYRNTIVVDEDHFPMAVVTILDLFRFIAYHFYH